MAQAQNMSPSASPGSGVRRVNNVPMYIFGSVVLAFLLVMALVAHDRASRQRVSTDADKKTGNTEMFAREIAGDASGIIMPQEPPRPTLDIVRPDNPDVPPVPQGVAIPDAPPPIDEEAQRFRTARLQSFDEARRSRIAVRTDAPRSSGSAVGSGRTPQTREEMLNQIAAVRQRIAAQNSEDPTAAYQARLAQVRAAAGGGVGGGFGGGASPLLLAGGTGGSRGSSGMEQFDASGGDRWRLDSQPQAPRTSYELRAGYVIPATLISGINSDLPGQIVAQVSQSVYDTPTGKHLLIPQGSRLVGRYSSDVAYGQARVLVAWQRIIFPDGKAMDIGAMPGADSAGYAGFHDKVDNHYFRLFASAFLMSGVTAGIAYSQRRHENDNSASAVLSEAVGQQLGQVTAQLIAKNMGIAPTLQIRPGFRFNVVVTKDLTFTSPYQSLDYR